MGRSYRLKLVLDILSLVGIGLLLLVQTGCDVPARTAPDLVWGLHGVNPGHLHKPRAAAFDAQDHLFLADLTDRIQVFDRDGNYLRGWPTPDFNVDGPSGLTVDRFGRLLVADTHLYRVLVYSPTGEVLLQIGDGVQGTTPGRFGYPTDVVIDRAGNFYVSEYGENDRIQVFSPEGKWLRQWGGHGYEPGEFLKPRRLPSTNKTGFSSPTVATTASRSSTLRAIYSNPGAREVITRVNSVILTT